MNKIVTVNFQGTEIYGLQTADGAFVAVRPMAEAMGLSWGSQYNRIKRDPILSQGVFIMKIPFGPGGAQSMVCLELELVHGWLFKIESNRVRNPVLRERIQTYQRECYRVLYTYFSKDREQLVREANDADSLSLRLVQEARHVWGERAAAELWEKRGLPKVPSMKDTFRQRDLFEHLESQAA